MKLLVLIALTAAPDESTQLEVEARALLKEKKVAAARAKVERCTERNPKAARCWRVLAHALTLESKAELARAAFEQYLALLPNPSEPALRGGYQLPAVDYP